MRIINAGVPGMSTSELLMAVPSLAAQHKPDLAILMSGTNDSLNSQKFLPAKAMGQNLRRIIDVLRNANAMVIISTLIPCLDTSVAKRHAGAFSAQDTPSQHILHANEEISPIAHETGSILADAHAAFIKHGCLGESASCLLRNVANSGVDDGVHPTVAGYALLAQTFASAIPPGLSPDAMILCLGDSITAGVHMAGEGKAEGDTYPGQLAKLLQHQGV